MDEQIKNFLKTDQPKVIDGQRKENVNQELAKQSEKASILEAAGFTEVLVDLVNEEARKRNLSREQVVFAISLMCINFRETCPDGKDWFDYASSSAWEYYAAQVGSKD